MLQQDKLLIGWEEWCRLDGLSLPAIKAKVDTGAKTSALHAFNVQPFVRHRKDYVHFHIYPLQRNRDIVRHCTAPLIDYRRVMNSFGHQEWRYVIRTPLQLGDLIWEIDITLANRAGLTFRMLLGREALNSKVLIDPAHALLLGKHTKKELHRIYRPM